MKIMAVDDERLALNEFRDTCGEIEEIDSVVTFSNPMDALGYAAVENVDVAFLDMEMPIVRGVELAERLKKISPNMKIVFVTGYAKYAIDAFSVDAVDYVLKPYNTDMIRHALQKANQIKDVGGKPRVFVKTFGYFDVFIDDKPVAFSGSKAKELYALLIDRRGGVVSTEQAVAVLWNDREYNETVQSLFRKVLKSLRNTLEEYSIEDTFVDNRNQRAVDVTKFSCDYYDLLDNKPEAYNEFFGKYMAQYEWAKETQNIIIELCEKNK